MTRHIEDIRDVFLIMAVFSMLFLYMAPGVHSNAMAGYDVKSTYSLTPQAHGDAKEIGYKVVFLSDKYGNNLAIYIHAYLLPTEGPLNYSYPNQHEAAIIYTITVRQSPAGNDGWGLKDGNSDHHTVIIEFNNPKSGDRVVDFSEGKIPANPIKEDNEGTITYGFALSWGASLQVPGAEAHLDENAYVSWSIPVYQYVLKPLQLTTHDLVAAGDVNSASPFNHKTYFAARTYTAGVSVEYPYLDSESQSVHIYVKGNFHQWVWFGKDSSVSWSYTWVVIHGGHTPT